tara:strand:+ start:564 stop:1064 length:501 start_codon:yes stop_codon:yes gene_type:complete
MSKLNYLYLGLGSNLGDKLNNIHLAYCLIQKKIGVICRKSFVYKTPPWGFDSEEYFFNSVILVKSNLTANDVLAKIKWIEARLGRETSYTIGYSSRIIDIDILDFNNDVNETESLILPHPHIEKRSFVLYPLQDVNSKWVHPKSNSSLENLITNLDKNTEISRVIF